MIYNVTIKVWIIKIVGFLSAVSFKDLYGLEQKKKKVEHLDGISDKILDSI